MNYPFLAQVDDAFDDGELRNRIRNILRRMELLSEARAMSLEQSVHGGEPDNLPPGVRKEASIAKPSRDRSLFERYLWEFERCASRPDPQAAFSFLCHCAEQDYRRYLQGPGASGVAGDANLISEGQGRLGWKVEDEKGDEVVEHYEGVPAAEVAMRLQQRVEWVQKVRRQRGRIEETGRPKPDWRHWSKFTRDQEVSRREAQGMNPAQIAGDLGISERTVRRHTTRDHRRAA